MKAFLIFASFILTSCGATDQTFGVKIINGDRAFGNFPAVKKIRIHLKDGKKGICTGFFISDSVMLTAAHCLTDAKKVSLDKTLWPDTKAISWQINDAYDPQKGTLASFQQDIAIVNFPDRTSNHWLTISKVPPKAGSKFTMVGFGTNDPMASLGYSSNGGDAKRSGQTKISCVNQNLYLSETVFIGEKGPAVSAPGDSGGPAIANGEVFGVIVGNHSNLASGTFHSFIISLYSTAASDFLRKQNLTVPL